MKKKIVVMLILVMAIGLSGCKSSDYNNAVALQEAGDYAGALELYKGINGYESYKDAGERVSTCEAMVEAIERYENAKAHAEGENQKIEAAVEEAEALIGEGKPPVDESLITTLEAAVSVARAEKQELGEMPETAEEIMAAAESLEDMDASEAVAAVTEGIEALKKSTEQYALVDAPTEAYIIECLKNVEGIIEIEAVTEETDVNGKLNKAGGYTAQIFFTSDLLPEDAVLGESPVEKATDGGGSIEVYANRDDAEKRDSYLGGFDGTIFATGSHRVVGTVIVRTSDELTASQQKIMEARIVAALLGEPAPQEEAEGEWQTLEFVGALIKASADGSGWNYFEVLTSEEDRLITVQVGMDGAADMVGQLKASGIKQNDGWDNVKDSLIKLCEDYYETCIELTGEPLHIGIQLVNDTDKSLAMLGILDGEIIYDVLTA